MNNSFIAVENVALTLETTVDNTETLRESEARLLRIIEAIDVLEKSPAWQVLKNEVFDGVVTSLKRQRDFEVEKKPLNGPLIHDINGQLKWAKKYSNFASLADIYKLELSKIRKELNAKGRN